MWENVGKSTPLTAKPLLQQGFFAVLHHAADMQTTIHNLLNKWYVVSPRVSIDNEQKYNKPAGS